MTRRRAIAALPVATFAERTVASTSAVTYRSFITLGALRCDCDVGLHVLVETFLV